MNSYSNSGWYGDGTFAVRDVSYSQPGAVSQSWNASGTTTIQVPQGGSTWVDESYWPYSTQEVTPYVKEYTNHYHYAQSVGEHPYSTTYEAAPYYDTVDPYMTAYSTGGGREYSGNAVRGYDQRHENVSDCNGNVQVGPSCRALSAEKYRQINYWLGQIQFGGPPPYDRNDPLLPPPPRSNYFYPPQPSQLQPEYYQTDSWAPFKNVGNGWSVCNPTQTNSLGYNPSSTYYQPSNWNEYSATPSVKYENGYSMTLNDYASYPNLTTNGTPTPTTRYVSTAGPAPPTLTTGIPIPSGTVTSTPAVNWSTTW